MFENFTMPILDAEKTAPEEKEFVPMMGRIGIDREQLRVGMEISLPVEKRLQFTVEEAEKIGMLLISKAAILRGIIDEEDDKKTSREKS